SLTLIGPDGIYLTPWFRLVSSPFTKKMIKNLINRPSLVEGLTKFFRSIRLIQSYTADFIQKELLDKEDSMRVYQSWNAFKTIGFTHSELVSNLNASKIETQVIVGTKDAIITPQKITPILKKIENCTIRFVPLKHHQLVDESISVYLLQN
ncbi:MAG: hypothetical protein AAF789_13515, partial [Bacteroidota bacterium]